MVAQHNRARRGRREPCRVNELAEHGDIEQRVPDTSAPIVLYCGGGFRSALSADNLQKMGYTNVLSMDGGHRSWRERGFPLVSD